MPRFSTNISMMFLEHAFLDRIAAAADTGFAAIEIQFPYDTPPEDILGAKEKAELDVAVFNLPVGDMLTGGPGLAAMPGRQAEFIDACALGRRYAEALRPRNVNVLSGWPPADIEREDCLAALVENIAHAAEVFAGIGVKVVVEAVNNRDRPGFFLNYTDQSLDAIGRAGHRNLGLEYDLYHMQIMEGDLVPTLERVIDQIGHIQFADTPGRHEPGTGEINFPFVFDAIDRLRYQGFVGAEYVPSGKTVDTLGWLKPYL